MIRVLLIAAGFLIVTITLLLLQPGSKSSRESYANAPDTAVIEIEQVSRSETNLTRIAPVKPQPSSDHPAQPETMISNILNSLAGSPDHNRPQNANAAPFPLLDLGPADDADPRALQLMIIQALK